MLNKPKNKKIVCDSQNFVSIENKNLLQVVLHNDNNNLAAAIQQFT